MEIGRRMRSYLTFFILKMSSTTIGQKREGGERERGREREGERERETETEREDRGMYILH